MKRSVKINHGRKMDPYKPQEASTLADRYTLMITRRKKRKKKPSYTVRKWDPLFVIFEKHLYDFNYESRELFIKSVVDDYVGHLSQQKVLIPPGWRGHLERTLGEEVSDMLVRRLYGCLTVEEFKEKPEIKDEILSARKEARKRYQKLAG